MYIARGGKFHTQYKKLPKKLKDQFVQRLKLYLNDPHHPLLHTHSLSGQYKHLKSFNVSADIRAIFNSEDGNKLFFIAIGSHSELFT